MLENRFGVLLFFQVTEMLNCKETSQSIPPFCFPRKHGKLLGKLPGHIGAVSSSHWESTPRTLEAAPQMKACRSHNWCEGTGKHFLTDMRQREI